MPQLLDTLAVARESVEAFTLTNRNGLKARVMSHGARLIELGSVADPLHVPAWRSVSFPGGSPPYHEMLKRDYQTRHGFAVNGPDGRTIVGVEDRAQDAGLRPEEIDYINLHGTSTELNDRIETRAVKMAFGEIASQIPMSATKSMVGHPQGASGAAGLRTPSRRTGRALSARINRPKSGMRKSSALARNNTGRRVAPAEPWAGAPAAVLLHPTNHRIDASTSCGQPVHRTNRCTMLP